MYQSFKLKIFVYKNYFRKYVHGPMGEILIYYRGNEKGIMMYEFSTKTYSYVWGWSSAGFDLYVPTTLVNGADGILATGNFSVPWIRSF